MNKQRTEQFSGEIYALQVIHTHKDKISITDSWWEEIAEELKNKSVEFIIGFMTTL